MPKEPESYVSKCPRCQGMGFVRVRAMIKDEHGKEGWGVVLVGCPSCQGAGVLKNDPKDPLWVPHNIRKEWTDE